MALPRPCLIFLSKTTLVLVASAHGSHWLEREERVKVFSPLRYSVVIGMAKIHLWALAKSRFHPLTADISTDGSYLLAAVGEADRNYSFLLNKFLCGDSLLGSRA